MAHLPDMPVLLPEDLGSGFNPDGGTFDPAEACRLAQNVARNAGSAVFPVREDKRPACPHGFKNASTDPAAIAELWRRYPGPLVGIATGAASNLAVLDLDAKHDEARAWWRQHMHRLPATRRYRTRSGGMHIYFMHRPGVGCTASKIARGADTRSDGGYVVAWFCAGFPCLDHSPPADWPQWLYDLLHPPAPATTKQDTRRGNRDAAIAGILRTVADATEGNRNARVFWAACRLKGHGISQADALADLLPAARDIGLDKAEARAAIASAWRRA